jgi:hypothetical protein
MITPRFSIETARLAAPSLSSKKTAAVACRIALSTNR